MAGGEVVSDLCLTCLCEASSQCDLKSRCVNDVCGPFRMTRGYWIGGGSLGEGGTIHDIQYALNTQYNVSQELWCSTVCIVCSQAGRLAQWTLSALLTLCADTCADTER